MVFRSSGLAGYHWRAKNVCLYSLSKTHIRLLFIIITLNTTTDPLKTTWKLFSLKEREKIPRVLDSWWLEPVYVFTLWLFQESQKDTLSPSTAWPALLHNLYAGGTLWVSKLRLCVGGWSASQLYTQREPESQTPNSCFQCLIHCLSLMVGKDKDTTI